MPAQLRSATVVRIDFCDISCLHLTSVSLFLLDSLFPDMVVVYVVVVVVCPCCFLLFERCCVRRLLLLFATRRMLLFSLVLVVVVICGVDTLNTGLACFYRTHLKPGRR